MGIQINGATDSITAIDGTIDVVSAIGNAGVLTATAFVGNITGNVTGNINHASNLELQVGGVTRGDFNSSGVLSITKGTSGGATANTDAALIVDNSSHTYVQFRTPNNKEQGLLFGDDADNDAGNIIYNHSNNALTFATNGGSNERLRITSTGLGIGGVTPTRELTIYSPDSGSTYINLTNSTTGATSGDGFAVGLSGNEEAKLWNYENTPMIFATNTAERLRIGSNGSVGIGTDYLSTNATTYHKLMVEGDTTSTIAVAKIVRKNNSASNSTYTFEVDSSVHTSNMGSGGAMAVDVYGGRAFTIDGNGKVGINTASMTKRLQMDTTGNSGEGILLKSTDSTYPAFMGDANRSAYDLFLVAFQGYWNGNRVGEITVEAGSDTTNKDEGMIKIRTRNAGDSSPQDRLTVYHTGQTEIHSTTDSSSSTTGALRVNGGIGVAKSVVADGFISNGGALSHRNVVINGGMEIAQRGTTSTGNTVGGYKTCDRWEMVLSSAGTWTVTRSGTCPDGFKHSMKFDCTTANTSLSATSFLSIRTNFEGQDLQRFAKGTTGAKAITVSFYVKTNKNGTYAVELYDTDNTKIATSLYTVSDNNWNRYEFTIPASTNTGQFDNDNNKSMNLGFILAAGTNYTNGTQYGTFVQGSNLNRAAGLTVNLADSTSNEFYLTGVQMEEGSVATPFEHRSFTEELTRCYRYYRRFGANASLPTPAPYNRFSIGYSPSSADVRFPFQLDPPMRINPVNSNFSKSGSFSIQPGSIGSYSLTCDNNSCSPSMLIAIMGSTTVSSGAGSAVSLHANNDTSAYIDISAEL